MKDLAAASELQAHIRSDPKSAHAIWGLVKEYVDAFRPVQLATPVDLTSTLTWDGTQRTLDLTSSTSASARWAIISVYMTKENDYPAPLAFLPVGSGTGYIWIVGDRHYIDETDGSIHNSRVGGVYWIPLDANQAVDYNAPSGLTAKAVYLLGYSG